MIAMMNTTSDATLDIYILGVLLFNLLVFLMLNLRMKKSAK